jgi:hypothetical protein
VSQYVLAVAAFFIPMLVALLAFFLWLVIVVLLVRPYGVQFPLGPFRFGKRARAMQALTFSQYLFVSGVLCFGCGMLIVTTPSNYLEWKYFHGSSAGLAASGLLPLRRVPLHGGGSVWSDLLGHKVRAKALTDRCARSIVANRRVSTQLTQ